MSNLKRSLIVAGIRRKTLLQIKPLADEFGTVLSMTDPVLGTAPTLPALPTSSPIAPELGLRNLLTRMDVSGPRYTSYPTADRFVEAFGPTQYQQAIQQRGQGVGALTGSTSALSVYVHIPFCESVCYYCACNKVITKQHDRATEYLNALRTEIEMVCADFGRVQTVSQLHLGGGTPTFLTDDQLESLLDQLQRAFRFVPGGECAIEIDPRTINPARLKRLSAMGFNRLSFGVQDFDPLVQQAIHRVQPREQVVDLVEAVRAEGFDSLNMDLIYGLPRQTLASFQTTLSQVAELKPDRIALYAYAHLPQRFKPQRRIDTSALPKADDKIAMLSMAIETFTAAG
jgi:oxygen-independent coproporphyrinogen-3 oxidase